MSAVTSLKSIEALSGSFLGLTTIAVALRFYARKTQGARFGADDWCMLVALLAFIVVVTCIFVLGHNQWIGYGNYPFPQDELPARYAESQKFVITFDIATHLALAASKASALFFYRRIFYIDRRRCSAFNLTIIATLIVLACWLITFSFLAGFQCHGNFKGLSNPVAYNQHCSIAVKYITALYITDVVLDIWVLLLPLPGIIRLHMTPVRKLCTAGIFMLAFVGFGASIARMVNVVEIFEGLNSITNAGPEDPNTRIFWYSILELGMSIIAINLPILWGIITKIGPEQIVKVARSVTSLASQVLGSSASKSGSSAGGRSGSGSRTGGSRGDISDDSHAAPENDAIALETLDKTRVHVHSSVHHDPANKAWDQV